MLNHIIFSHKGIWSRIDHIPRIWMPKVIIIAWAAVSHVQGFTVTSFHYGNFAVKLCKLIGIVVSYRLYLTLRCSNTLIFIMKGMRGCNISTRKVWVFFIYNTKLLFIFDKFVKDMSVMIIFACVYTPEIKITKGFAWKWWKSLDGYIYSACQIRTQLCACTCVYLIWYQLCIEIFCKRSDELLTLINILYVSFMKVTTLHSTIIKLMKSKSWHLFR